MPKHVAQLIVLMTLAGVIGTVAPIRAQNEPDSARLRVGRWRSRRRSLYQPWMGQQRLQRQRRRQPDERHDGHCESQRRSLASDAARPGERPQSRGHVLFSQLTSLRVVDNDHSGRVELIVNRVMPWVSGSLVTTRHRQNLEIDAIAKRRNDVLRAGADVRLTDKSSTGFYASRGHVEYQNESLFRGTDLARALNHTGSVEGLGFRYAVTPLTTFAVNVEQGRDRFAFLSERNSNSLLISPSVEFKPLAIISGRAAIGFRNVTFRDGRQPEFKSSVASVDLQYTLRSRTQLTVGAQRDLEYSVHRNTSRLCSGRVHDVGDAAHRKSVGRRRTCWPLSPGLSPAGTARSRRSAGMAG